MKRSPSFKQGDAKNHLMLSEGFTFCTVLVLVVSLIFSIVTKALSNHFDFKATAAYVFISYLLMSASVFFGGFIAVRRGGYPIREVAPLKTDKMTFIIVGLVLLGTYFGLSGVNQWFLSFLEGFGYVADVPAMAPKTPLNVILSVVFICIVPALSEEFLFRGVLIRATKSLGQIWCAVISAAAFSLYHMSPNQTVYQFIVGILYAVIAIKLDSLVPTVILHFLNNLLVVCWYYFYPQFSLTGPLQIAATLLGLVALGAALILLFKRGTKGEERLAHTKTDRIEFFMAIGPGFLCCLVIWIANLVA